MAVSGTFLELMSPEQLVKLGLLDARHAEDEEPLGRTVILYDDCSECGRSTPHQFILLERNPRVWGRACLEH
jgi:hypothetical protein